MTIDDNYNCATPLPSAHGEVDWDQIADHYDDWVMSPFSHPMMQRDASGRIRNRLVQYLYDIEPRVLANASVADFGCGPGGLLPAIAGRVSGVTGIDKSRRSLELASLRARELRIAFEGICANLRTMRLGRAFDFVISVNSILPAVRSDVALILQTIKVHLADDGQLLAILPSFEAAEHLRELWLSRLRTRRQASEKEIEAAAQRFDDLHKTNRSELIFAEDATNQQCCHTLASIEREFGQVGLEVVSQPDRVNYPWDLTRHFGWGFFPECQTEIWDWFVVAQRKGARP